MRRHRWISSSRDSKLKSHSSFFHYSLDYRIYYVLIFSSMHIPFSPIKPDREHTYASWSAFDCQLLPYKNCRPFSNYCLKLFSLLSSDGWSVQISLQFENINRQSQRILFHAELLIHFKFLIQFCKFYTFQIFNSIS